MFKSILRLIEYIKAYKTNSIIVLPPDNSPEGRDQVEKYFSDKSKCGAEMFLSIQQIGPFMLFVYDNEHDCDCILAQTHQIGQNELKVTFIKILKEFFVS